MELFHKYYGSQCQLALDLMAQPEHRDEFTFAELLRLTTHDHAGVLAKQMIDELVNAGVLMRSENDTYCLGESMRPPLPLLERSYLAYLCTLPEAEPFLPPETLAHIHDHCGDIDRDFFAPFLVGVRQRIESVSPEVFRPMLMAIAQRKYVNYLYCPQNTDTWIPAEDMIPFRLEHSVLAGRWWVIVYLPDQDRPVKARMEHIKDVQVGQTHRFTEDQIRAVIRRLVEPDPVVLRIRPEKNALERAKLKTSVSRLVCILFPELEKLVPSLHLVSVYALLEEFPGAKQIAAANLTRLKFLLADASKGHYGRDMAVTIRDAAKTSIGSVMPAKSLELRHTIRLIRELDAEIADIEASIQSIMEELRSPITTIPGIGFRMAAMILAKVGDFSRFDSPDKVLAYAGLSPSTYQSGQLNNCYAHMEKRGSRYLRYAIYNATKYVCHWDPTFAAYLAKKPAEGKHYNVALSHAAKKLVRLIFALEKSGMPYQPRTAA